jgi:hypothetical protein
MTFADSGAGNEGYSYDLTRGGFPRGFRVLVINQCQLTGVLANFANQIVEWNGSAWKTKYEFGTTSNHNQVQVAVIDEGKNV